MTAINMLKQDHKKVQALFRKFETAGSAPRQKEIGEKVFEELDVHTSLEEEIFYPAVKSVDDSRGESLVREAVEEHDIVGNLVKELKGLAPDSSEYQAKFAVLMENVEHHIKEEEGQMLPLAATVFDRRQLTELGNQMIERKRKLTSPGLISEAFGQAKELIAEAVGALTGSSSKMRASRASSGPAKAGKTKPQPQKSAAAKTKQHATQARPRHGGAKTQQTMTAVARKAARRKTGGSSARTRTQRGGTKQRS